jgi:hypothetical protein
MTGRGRQNLTGERRRGGGGKPCRYFLEYNPRHSSRLKNKVQSVQRGQEVGSSDASLDCVFGKFPKDIFRKTNRGQD